MSKRLRNFVFTFNNYTQQDVDRIYNYEFSEYVIIGFEIGESGTPHMQGYMELKKQLGFNRVKTDLGDGIHIESRKGTQKQAIDYCKKDGQFVENGVAKKSGKRNDISRVKEIIYEEDGTMMDVISEATSYQALRSGQILLTYKPPKQKFFPKTVHWFWGPSGTNKTRTAVESCSDDYWISGENLKWFDGYFGQKFVIIDDFRKDFCTFHFLLRLLDVYHLRVPYKGGFVEWNPDLIFITSCYAPSDVYETREDIYQLLRRITEIRYFPRIVPPIVLNSEDRNDSCQMFEKGYCNCIMCIPQELVVEDVVKMEVNDENVYPGH